MPHLAGVIVSLRPSQYRRHAICELPLQHKTVQHGIRKGASKRAIKHIIAQQSSSSMRPQVKLKPGGSQGRAREQNAEDHPREMVQSCSEPAFGASFNERRLSSSYSRRIRPHVLVKVRHWYCATAAGSICFHEQADKHRTNCQAHCRKNLHEPAAKRLKDQLQM